MTKSIFTTVFATLLMLFVSYNSNGQNTKKEASKAIVSSIQVIQFHSERRCVTCNLIENLTKETLKQNFSTIPFSLVNVDDSKNEKMAEQFEATGTALFLYNPKTGKKKDLTDFAFMNAKSKPEEFKKGLIEEIKKMK